MSILSFESRTKEKICSLNFNLDLPNLFSSSNAIAIPTIVNKFKEKQFNPSHLMDLYRLSGKQHREFSPGNVN